MAAGLHRPRPPFAQHLERAARQIDIGIARLAVQALGQVTVLEHQQCLDHSGDAGRRLEVADIGFHRAEVAALRAAAAQFGESLLEPADLDRIAQPGARAVDLDVADAVDIDSPAGLLDQVGLGPGVGRGQRIGVAAMVLGRADDGRHDAVAVGQRLPVVLEDQDADAFAPHIAVGIGGKGLAASSGAEHARLGGPDEHHGFKAEVDATGDRHRTVTAQDGLRRPVHRHQRAGAGRIDRCAGPVEIEQVGDPVGDDRVGVAGGVVGTGRRAGQQAAVVGRGDADIDPGVAATQASRADSRIFEGRPGLLQHETVLRVHRLRLAGGDFEKIGVEGRRVLDEAARAGKGFPQVAALCNARQIPVGKRADRRAPLYQQLPECLGIVRTGKAPGETDNRHLAGLGCGLRAGLAHRVCADLPAGPLGRELTLPGTPLVGQTDVVCFVCSCCLHRSECLTVLMCPPGQCLQSAQSPWAPTSKKRRATSRGGRQWGGSLPCACTAPQA